MTVEELNTFVRFVLGGLPTTTLDDTTLNQIIQNVLDSGIAVGDCQEKYYSIKQTLIYLETKSTAENAGNNVLGGIKKRVEEVGRRRIELEWGGTGGSETWESLLEDFISDPQAYLLCDPFPSDNDNGGGTVIIGVHKNKWDMETPWRQNQNRKCRFKY